MEIKSFVANGERKSNLAIIAVKDEKAVLFNSARQLELT